MKFIIKFKKSNLNLIVIPVFNESLVSKISYSFAQRTIDQEEPEQNCKQLQMEI